MKKFRVLPVLLMALPLLLVGCLDDGDDDDDPNSDSSWSVFPDGGGVNGAWVRVADGSDPATVSLNGGPSLCEVIDTDGDSSNDDSKRTIISMTSGASGTGTGSFKVEVFLGDTACNQDTPDSADYVDSSSFTYTGYSSSFDFNRLDVEITGVSRTVNSDAAAAVLITASACGLTSWANGSTVTDVTGCTNASSDHLSGFQLTDNGVLQATGDILEGVFIVSGSIMSIEMGSEGNRPQNPSVDTSSNDYWTINGAEMFYRFQ